MLLEFQLRPCQKCIVRAMCRGRCPIIQNRLDFGDTVITIVIRILLVAAALTIATNGGEIFFK